MTVRALASEGGWIGGAEIRCAVDRIEKANVRLVKKIERLGDHLETLALLERNGARDAEIHRPEVVANKGVARLDADAVVVAKNIAVGIEAGKLGEAHRRLNRGDQAEEKVARDHVPRFWSGHRAVQHQAIAHIVGGDGPFRTEILAVLRNQHEAGIWPVVYGLGPGVANPIRELMRQALIHVDQQAVVLRIPARGGFKINGDRRRAHARVERAWHGPDSAIFIFGTRASARVMQSNDLRWIRLVHIEKAAEVHAAHMQPADTDRGVRPRIEFQGYAGLHAVRISVILIEAHHNRRPKESAIRDRRTARKTIRG